MSSQTEQIKDRLSVVDVLGSYIKLEKAGANYKARCPFHQEKTPSFFVSPDRNSYYCFGCGEKGDIFSFVERFEGVDFVGALRILAARAGIELKKVDPSLRNERQKQFLAMEYATVFYQKQLWENPARASVIEYLTGRGLTRDTIKEWRIGYAPNEWRMLSDFLVTKKFTPHDLESVGLTKKRDTGIGAYDRFRGRIMFPLLDPSSRVVGFSGRIFEGDEKEAAKYLNSPETDLFHKSSFLYGFHKAKTAIREQDCVVLVEGQMDLLMSHQVGVAHTVAVSGTALTGQHLVAIQRLTSNVVMAFDPDSAGVSAAMRSAVLALGLGMRVKAVELPPGKDPADLIKENPDAWKQALGRAVHVIEFILNAIVAKYGDSLDLLKAIRTTLLPFVKALDSAMDQSHFVALIAARARVKESAIWKDLESVKALSTAATDDAARGGDRGGDVTDVVTQASSSQALEKTLMSILLWKKWPLLEQSLRDIMGGAAFDEARTSAVAEQDRLILEVEVVYERATHLEQEVESMLRRLDAEYQRRALATATTEAQQSEVIKRIGALPKKKYIL